MECWEFSILLNGTGWGFGSRDEFDVGVIAADEGLSCPEICFEEFICHYLEPHVGDYWASALKVLAPNIRKLRIL